MTPAPPPVQGAVEKKHFTGGVLPATIGDLGRMLTTARRSPFRGQARSIPELAL